MKYRQRHNAGVQCGEGSQKLARLRRGRRQKYEVTTAKATDNGNDVKAGVKPEVRERRKGRPQA